MVIRVLALLLAVVVSPSSDALPDTHQIALGSGDVLSIKVYNEPDLSVTQRIAKDGTIKVPLIGIFTAAGKAAHELEHDLEGAYFDGYLVNPIVTVSVQQYRPFYIKGAVNKAGVYDYSVDLTVDQAVAMAGGLKDRASADKWYIRRAGAGGRTKVARQTQVLPGDTIEIEESIF